MSACNTNLCELGRELLLDIYLFIEYYFLVGWRRHQKVNKFRRNNFDNPGNC